MLFSHISLRDYAYLEADMIPASILIDNNISGVQNCRLQNGTLFTTENSTFLFVETIL